MVWQAVSLELLLAILLFHSSQLIHAQAGVIDDSQYIAGKQAQ